MLMIKASHITLFTSIALFFSTILAEGIVIEHDLPENLQPGEKTLVTVNINKGDVAGFAKLQIEIPFGLTARGVKKSGASFTFSGQKVKFIWMTLPADQEFQVEYELEASNSAKGSKVVEGQFSYIKKNERIDYNLSPQVIRLGAEDIVAENTTADTQTEALSFFNDTETELQNDVVCTRILTPLGSGKYFVEVSVDGMESNGFAIIREEFSAGFEITEDTSGEAKVTLEENGVKYVWFERPSDPNHSVSYTLTATYNSENPVIKGKLSYLANDQPIEISIVQQEIISFQEDGGNNTDLVENTKTEIEPTINSNGENTEEVEEVVYADNSAEITNTPSPEKGINYKIQLAATHTHKAASTFRVNHKFAADIETENHDGWTKFVTGSHDEYKSARDARNNISAEYSKFDGPFVTAYNNGDRITVQEALMVSKQKWYQ